MPADLPVRKARKITHNFLIYKFFVERFHSFRRSPAMTQGAGFPQQGKARSVKTLIDGRRMFKSLLESIVNGQVESVKGLIIQLGIAPDKRLDLRHHVSP